MKEGDICVVVQDKAPYKHDVPIGHNVLVEETGKEKKYPIKCQIGGRSFDNTYFRSCELKKICELWSKEDERRSRLKDQK